MSESLKTYRAKRNFAITSEPEEGGEPNAAHRSFVIQKHWATRLHYDFRLELDGAMKSWAVPKGPSYDPKDKRMAVHVEDHPISYNQFEGEIPAKQYGAGKVIIWDKGVWAPLGDAEQGYRDGNLKFELFGHKMRGKWVLVRMKGRGEKQEPWLLIKEKDAYVQDGATFSVVDEFPDSVAALPLPDEALARMATFEMPREDGGKAGKAASKSARKPASNASSVAARKAAKADMQAAVEPPAPSPARKSSRKTAVASRPDLPEGAVPADLPATFQPQLATLVDGPPSDSSDWVYEIKFDGYRMLARIEGKTVTLFTRNGNDWTHKLKPLAQTIQALSWPDGWYDGEITVLNARGVPDFQSLQNAFDKAATKDIVFYLFDVPYCDGHDLRSVPLTARRAYLQSLFTEDTPDAMRYSDTFDAPPVDVVASACQLGLEGVIGKRKSSTYVSRRSRDWIKLKCSKRQEFVIGGYTDPQGARTGFGSLMLGVHDEDGKLQYAGNVGTGFNDKTLTEVTRRLEALATRTRPFATITGIDRKAHWVEPTLLAEVSFGEWTGDGRIRHAVFHGLRSDKPAKAIIREAPSAPPEPDTSEATEGDTTEDTMTAVKTTSAKKATKTAVKTAAARTEGDTATSRKTAAKKAVATRATAMKATATEEAKAPRKAARKAAGASASNEAAELPAGLKISHPDRVIDASTGITKLDVIKYYAQVAPLILEHLADRPVSLVRAPEGIGGELFFQKHMEAAKMAGVTLLPKALDPGHAPLMEITTAAGLLSAAQMNVLEFHTWNGTKQAIAKPDRMTFDLDPGDGVGWPAMQEAAHVVRAMLEQLEIACFVKTSGGKGLHVVVPLQRRYDWDTVKDFSQAIVQHLAKTLPKRFSAKSGPKNRVGKIFVDYLRNGFGATTVSAWSLRSRPGLGVSVPLRWDEVNTLESSSQWNLQNIQTRLEEGNDPWADYAASGQSITQGMKILGFKPAKP
jgi:bifunctional non-homologous end joining protein LigD